MSLIVDAALGRRAEAAARPTAAHGTWFELPGGSGPLLLHVAPDAPAARHAAEAAVLLHRCEGLLEALEDWSGQPMPWRWVPAAPGAAVSAAAPARLQWRDGGHTLRAPWSWLRALPPPAAELERRLGWPALPAVLGIARLRLEPAELQQLEPGGALLLPPAMQPDWIGLLRGADEADDAGVPLRLAPPLPPRPVSAGDRDAARAAALAMAAGAEGVPCEVRLTLAAGAGADVLAGWCARPLGALLSGGLAAALWRCASSGEPARCLAAGALMPWGDGWALHVHAPGENSVTPQADDTTVVMQRA